MNIFVHKSIFINLCERVEPLRVIMYFLITKIEEIDMFLFKWKMVTNAISSLKEKKKECA
jgi:hypothetical protein